MMKKLILTPLFLFICLCIYSGSIFAQGTTSRVTGTVTDSSGATVAGATVTLTDEGTNVSLKTETSDSGSYTFDLIPAGTYTITAEKQGFKKYISKGNAANVNQPATVNIALPVGDVAATVTVEGTAEKVQTSTSGNIGSTVEQRTLESLPIVGTRGRNPLDLLNFQPGVVTGGNTGGAVNVNGSRDRAFNFTLDGVDINESSAGGSNFTPLRPNPDSIQEFQIVTSNFTAELGRSSGAQVTLVTRSGTNEFHGNLFEYYQTPRFNAKSYPNTIANAPKDQFVQHIFGGSIGGPLSNFGLGEGTPFKLLKNKAFFFVNLQLLRAYDTALVQRTVYTANARAGLFRYVVGRANAPSGTSTAAVDTAGNTTLPPCSATVTTLCINSYNIANNPTGVSFDPTLSAAINSQPLPNDFTGGDGLNTAFYDFGSPEHEKQYDFTTKVDYKFTDRSSMYVRYAQGQQNTFGDAGNSGRPIFPNFPNLVNTYRSPKNLAINWRWSPTARLANEFILGYSKFGFDFNTASPDPSIPYTFLTIVTPNTNFIANARRLRTWQYIDNITFDASPHILKAGINFRFGRQIDLRSSAAGIGTEPAVSFGNGPGFAAFGLPTSGTTGINATDLSTLQATINNELGRVSSVTQAFVSDPNNPSVFAPAGTRWNFKAYYPELDFYAQDNWRFRPNLVVDLGVRWEIKLNPSSSGRPILVPNQSFTLGSAPSNTLKWVPGDLFKNDYGKVLPSVGFAWDPFKSGKTSIRVNYRISSDRIATQLFAASIYQNIPGNVLAGTNTTFGAAGGLYRNVGPIIAGLAPSATPDALRQPAVFSTASINVIDPNLQFPQIHSWSASFQREIWKNNVLEVNYIGKHGVHLLGGYNANQVNVNTSVAGISESFLQAFNSVKADSTYNSPLLNFLYTGNSANNAGTASFRTLNSSAIANGNVATAALAVSQRTCVAADVTSGFCSATGLQLLSQTAKNPFLFQKYTQFSGGLNVFDSNDYSWYHGLEIIVKRRITNGLGYQLGYTLSKSMDDRSWDPSLSTISTGSSQSASSTPFDNNNRSLNYAYSDFDRRHVFQATFVYELPFGKGKMVNIENKFLNYAVGGWQLSGTGLWTSGRPFTVFSGLNTVSNTVQSTANCTGCSRDIGKLIVESGKNFWFDAATRALFSAPAPGQQGNTPRNFFITPKTYQLDTSLFKKFRITERMNFDLRVDARNLTNTPNFDLPTAVINSTIFGRINNSVTNNARRIQLSGKLNF